MPPPLSMGSIRWPLFMAFVVMVSLFPVNDVQAEDTTPSGATLDVAVLTAACLENSTCEAQRPTHLVEYFSADWCEPCLQVSDQLQNLTSEDVVVLQHHPSTQDATFLSSSKLRNDLDYRLLFYPSLVVDGTALLTGTRQAMDLESVMENITTSWTGLDNLTLENETLRWDTSDNGTVAVWLVAPAAHETANRTHPSVAYGLLTGNATDGELTIERGDFKANTSLIVLLERSGPRTLNVASLAPTGALAFDGEADDFDGGDDPGSEAFLPALIGVFFIVLLLPALVIHRNLVKQPRQTTTTEKGSEE
ncbi:MAG TPA: hypothetical protein HA353_00970 [Candidatus Poseidonia sp.]|nr:hypothetical protein [Poseidonia sp.]